MGAESPTSRFDALLSESVKRGASDVHLSVGAVPSLRIDGTLVRLEIGEITAAELQAIVESIASPWHRREFETRRTIDIGYSTPDEERFRINVYQEMANPAIAVRHLDQRMLSFQDLRLPSAIRELAQLRSGLVLITGATGSGKSTTLAAIVDEINRTRACHILTIEDPIEFVHRPICSLIHHRELHTDVPSFAEAVRAALREDPDVILVGEMRDADTARAALTAAETGHLVFSTLHTAEAVRCVERLLGSFPTGEQPLVRHRVAMSLRAVVAQQLIAGSDRSGRVPAVEILVVNNAVANLIETAKTRQLPSAMETGAGDGMQTMTQSLAALVQQRLLSREDVLPFCSDPVGLDGWLESARRA